MAAAADGVIIYSPLSSLYDYMILDAFSLPFDSFFTFFVFSLG